MLCLVLAPVNTQIGAAASQGSAVLSVPVPIYSANTVSGVCADTEFVVMSGAEFRSVAQGPFYLDEAAAVAIGGAILLVMAVAFVFRSVRKSLESSESET